LKKSSEKLFEDFDVHQFKKEKEKFIVGDNKKYQQQPQPPQLNQFLNEQKQKQFFPKKNITSNNNYPASHYGVGNNCDNNKIKEKEEQLSEISSEKDENLCVICLDNKKNIVLVPCGHVCICDSCKEKNIKDCPICRTKIENMIKAYW
jgi:hypothetical protein